MQTIEQLWAPVGMRNPAAKGPEYLITSLSEAQCITPELFVF